LTKVRVSLDAPRETERMLRFRVDAVLKVHPSRPPVVFDAMLQLSSNAYQITEH
jgi:type VI secretion system protein ImpF